MSGLKLKDKVETAVTASLLPEGLLTFATADQDAGRFSAESWLAREYGNQRADGDFQLYCDGRLLDFSAVEAERLDAYLCRMLGLEPPAPAGPRSRLSPLAARTG